MNDAIYTLHEAAEHLHLPYRIVRDAVFAGHWPHRYISPRKRLMTGGDIAEVLEMTATQPSPAANPTLAEQRRVKDSIRELLSA